MFFQGVKFVIDCYRNANISHNQESWKIILSTYAEMAEDENKMWSMRKRKANLQENDCYEKMVQIFQQIGNVLEVSVKHIVQELYALIYLYNKGCVDYEKIRKQDFGVVINNILDQGLLQSVLVVEPYGMKLSDWRNIACHHTYSIDNGYINCTYGKGKINNIKISMKELEMCLYKIMRASNILNISRCIFVFDFIDDIPQNYILEKAFFRPEIKCEQFKIALLLKEFQLSNILLDEEKVEVDIQDLNEDVASNSRIVNCAQFLFDAWKIWKRKSIYINYFSNVGRKICCIYVNDEVCKSINEGKKEVTYLINKFKIKYF